MSDEERFEWAAEWRPLAATTAAVVTLYLLPTESARLHGALAEAVELARSYAREHVILCLLPAFFIAGAVSVFVRQGAVLRHLGAEAPKPLAYGIASVSGSLLAVCSCTVLPLFASIHRRGAGLGPATAFLYSGPAINVLALVLTATVLGPHLAVARGVGAVGFSVVVGLLMHAIYRKGERAEGRGALVGGPTGAARPAHRIIGFVATMVAILVFANWGRPATPAGPWHRVWEAKWPLTAVAALLLGAELVRWFGFAAGKLAAIATAVVVTAVVTPSDQHDVPFLVGVVGLSIAIARDDGELGEWFTASWTFAKQILPLLLVGVLFAGLLLGRPGHEGLVPAAWIERAVGGNALAANAFAAVAGAFMYFATLTEVPILAGLLGSGMGQGPALALLLAGPAVSLPSLLVLAGVLGWRKTATYAGLVVLMATVAGAVYGGLVAG